MRGIIAIVIGCVLWIGCGSGESAGAEEARKKAEAELEEKIKSGVPAKKITPPVAGQAKLPCEQLINAEAYTTALGEKDPLTVKDVTAPKGDEITSSCDLLRGGKKLTPAEQDALLKKDGRLGVLPGDVMCNVRALCYVIEDGERIKKRCAEKKEKSDDSMGSFACIQTVGTGRFDVFVFKFFDEDTKCVLEVRGGPSNTDNDQIRICAKTARDTIGPPQIAVKGP